MHFNLSFEPEFHIVDAFVGAGPHLNLARGNPAAVVLLESWPPDTWLGELANEFNLSETAFVVPRDGEHGDEHHFDLRWFTPRVEVDLCGHATLAAAHVLKGEKIVFHTRSGLLRVIRFGDLVGLDFPAQPVEPCELPTELAQALGIEAAPTFRASDDFLIELSSAELRALAPDFARLDAISRELNARGVIVTARSDDGEFDCLCRFFAPAVGINEDPVTGSAHTKLAPFWSAKLEKRRLRSFQSSERGGIVEMRWHGERVELGGAARTRARGVIK